MGEAGGLKLAISHGLFSRDVWSVSSFVSSIALDRWLRLDVIGRSELMIINKILVLVAACACLAVGTARAQSTKTDTDWATNELSSEMTERGQYFLVSWACFKDFPHPQAEAAAKEYRAASDQISELALQVGKSVGMNVQAATARMRLANDAMNKKINNNCANVSILQERYATFCKGLSQRPDQRFKELVQCSVNKKILPCGAH